MYVLDIFSVSIIGVAALSFILRYYFKMRKNKCATMCNGCSSDVCSVKVFKPELKQKVIPLKPISG